LLMHIFSGKDSRMSGQRPRYKGRRVFTSKWYVAANLNRIKVHDVKMGLLLYNPSHILHSHLYLHAKIMALKHSSSNL
jgi:hypothetical protein